MYEAVEKVKVGTSVPDGCSVVVIQPHSLKDQFKLLMQQLMFSGNRSRRS